MVNVTQTKRQLAAINNLSKSSSKQTVEQQSLTTGGKVSHFSNRNIYFNHMEKSFSKQHKYDPDSEDPEKNNSVSSGRNAAGKGKKKGE